MKHGGKVHIPLVDGGKEVENGKELDIFAGGSVS